MTLSMCSLKIAIQAGTDEVDSLKQLALSVRGARQILYDTGVAPLILPNSTLLEIYSPYSACPAYLFKNNKMVVSFKVDDLEQAVRMAIDQGLRVFTPVLGATLYYCHLELANGTVIGLYQDKIQSLFR